MNAYKLDIALRALKIFANALVLVAVGVAMYQASFSPDETLAVFSTWFFAQLASILLLTWLTLRVLRRRYPLSAADMQTSLIHWPRRGMVLARWRVAGRQALR